MSRVSPCVPWADELDLPPTCDLTAVTPQTLASAFLFSSDVLYNLTKRRWPGLCTDTFEPFTDNCCWFPRCSDYDMARRPWHSGIKLPAIDVVAITEVKVDGVVVPPIEYRLVGRYLQALRQPDGTIRGWPCWSDPAVAANGVGTFSIEYTHGANPPNSMVLASALLAWEFALAWTPECAGQCRLPQRVTTITRAGTTFAIIDSLAVIEKGGTGITDIDILIQSVNRGESYQRAFVGRPGGTSRASRR